MKETLLDKKNPYYALLQLGRLNISMDCGKLNSRTIEDWVSEIFPVPIEIRKGRPPKNGIPEHYFNDLIYIPEIYLEDGSVINFHKLRFAIFCIKRVLVILINLT